MNRDQILDVLYRKWIFEQFADIPEVVEEPVIEVFFQERAQQLLDEQMTDVPETSSQAQNLQRTRDQILDVPMLLMMEQLGEMPKMVSQTESSDGLLSRSLTCQFSRVFLGQGSTAFG